MARVDLTSGPIPKHLKSLWIPAFTAMFLQSCYALVNLVFVRMLGDRAVGAHGVTLQSFFIILAIGQMVGTTATADISQAYGRGEIQRARGFLSAYTLIAVALGAVASVLAYLFAEDYVTFLANDPAVIPLGKVYFESNAPTFLLQLVIIVLAGALRASGDFISPMRIMIASVLINAALDPFMIFGIGPFPEMGIAGAGWATVIAQALSLFAYAYRLSSHRTSRGDTSRLLRFARPAWSRGLFSRIVTRGFPAGLQFFVVYVITGITYLGVKATAASPHESGDWTGAVGAGFRVLQQIWLPIITLAIAAATLAGQNYGARQADRIRETARTAIRWGLIYGVIAAIATPLLAPILAHLGADAGGGQYDHTVLYLQIGSPIIIAFALTYVPTFILQAFGKTTLPLIAALVRVALLATFTFGVVPALGLGPIAIFVGVMVSAFVEGAIGWTFLRRFNRRLDFPPRPPNPEHSPTPGNDREASQAPA